MSPALFRRTVLTAALPEPEPADPAALNELRRLLNVDDDTWPLVVGWLVAALLPDVPHPVLLLGGEQGTGKSTAARLIVGLIDASPAPLRSEPREPRQWVISAAGSWCVVLDNVSHIPVWLSDAICKAVTGEGWIDRKLYTDSDLAVLAFRRCVVLTSIDPGALRGDLGDRLLLADLERIPDERRRTEAELEAAYHAARPRLLGALLSAAARTLADLPGVELKKMPRLADFARVLAAVDRTCPELTGGRALALFCGQGRRIAGDVVEGDAVAQALVKFMAERGPWQGTAGELLELVKPDHPPKDWPATGRGLAGRLKRLRPALLAVGIRHEPPPETDKTRTHRLERMAERPPEPPEPPAGGDSTQADSSPEELALGGMYQPTTRPPADRQVETGIPEAVEAFWDGAGGVGGMFPVTSVDGRERGEI